MLHRPSKYVKLHHLCVLYIFRYEQNFEGIPVIGDSLVITYEANGHVVNAFGSAARLNERRYGRLCDVRGSISKEKAIQMAKDEERRNSSEGSMYPYKCTKGGIIPFDHIL